MSSFTTESSVLVLIDYHNLPAELTRRGVAELWNRLRASIGAEVGDSENDTTLRLYGGWYDERGLSRDGDRVARDMDCSFPMVLVLFTVGDMYVSLCKIGAYAPFSVQRRSRALFWL